MKCPHCSQNHPEGTKYCIETGKLILSNIICTNCGASIPSDSLYCPDCGKELVASNSTSVNIMNRFPEYNFVPTNFYDWRKPWLARFATIIALIISVLLFVIAIGCFLIHNWVEGNIVLLIAIIFLLISLQVKRKYPSKTNHLYNYADYVQKYKYSGSIRGKKTPILKFYVKDNRMGLLDVAHYCVFLAAQYDKLEWRENNKYLKASLGNQSFIIDIYGKELK